MFHTIFISPYLRQSPIEALPACDEQTVVCLVPDGAVVHGVGLPRRDEVEDTGLVLATDRVARPAQQGTVVHLGLGRKYFCFQRFV